MAILGSALPTHPRPSHSPTSTANRLLSWISASLLPWNQHHQSASRHMRGVRPDLNSTFFIPESGPIPSIRRASLPPNLLADTTSVTAPSSPETLSPSRGHGRVEPSVGFPDVRNGLCWRWFPLNDGSLLSAASARLSFFPPATHQRWRMDVAPEKIVIPIFSGNG